MRIDPDCVGRRMTIRCLVPGRGPSGGPAMTDVVGRVLSVSDREVVLERRDGSHATVVLSDVVIAKVVPSTPVRSRGAMAISGDNLTRITSRGWPAVESVALGEWELRASDGFTARANSVAAHGDPGIPTEEAIGVVKEFYRSRGLTPLAQVVIGTDGERTFRDAGWIPVSDHPGAVVQVVRLTGTFPLHDDVRIDEHVSAEWLAQYPRAGDRIDAARAVLEGPDTVAFLSIGKPVMAIARIVVTGEWAGIACVEVAPAQRRRGLARHLVETALSWAREHGADKAYLQIMRENTAAMALYESYGFRTHHEYVYLATTG